MTVHAGETGPLDVRLEPCRSIAGRFVDKAGQPLPNGGISWISHHIGRAPYEGWLVTTDQNGRFETALVPRVRYSFGRRLTVRGMAGFLGEIALEPGQTKDLGDISPENNQAAPIN
jgi:hypothetical protein